VAGRCSRSLAIVVSETEELKEALVASRGLEPHRVSVVPLGVDHEIFRVQPQNVARERLGLRQEPTIALYVGGMDQYHDLSPLLRALHGYTPAQALEVHLVGDGEYRGRYEQLAQGLRVPVVFHGQADHRQVPEFIAAADVCLAPYQVRGFRNNQVAFSTLKIPEYMACGRPVISVPSGNILRLVEHGETGLLFPNEEPDWVKCLENFPSREVLARMGRAAAPAVAGLSWRATAQRYMELVTELGQLRTGQVDSTAGSRGL
jgi:glycosyltransferase involved in cell wall biosynthesis